MLNSNVAMVSLVLTCAGCCLLLGCLLMVAMVDSALPDAHPNLPYIGTCVFVSVSEVNVIRVHAKQHLSIIRHMSCIAFFKKLSHRIFIVV